MAARYGYPWVSQYGATPDGVAGAEWRETLGALTKPQVDDGFLRDKWRGAAWPPSSSVFRGYCLDIPELAEVRAQLRPGCPEVSAFTRAVWLRIDAWKLRLATDDQRDRMVREAYDLTRESVMRGEPLPEMPAAAIEAPVPPPRTRCSPEMAKVLLIDLAAELGVPAWF